MYIKKMEIFGFKSFADKTDIEFFEGITAVLGPNGVGKSNIVEAFLWVLGEQNSSRLRIDRSDGQKGLIFHGTEVRKPLSIAQVALVIENKSKVDGEPLVNIDADEIEVRRKLHRSGASEFFINDEPVRLKQITELFLGTGLGKNSYSVIKQGMVAEIANQTPEQRRKHIEEAAGVSKYLEDKRAALKKLDDSEANLKNVNTMIREVEKQYKTLKEQAEKTERFHKIDGERKKAKIDLNLINVLKAKQTAEELKKTGEELSVEKNALERELTELDDRKKLELERVEQLRHQAGSLEKRSLQIFEEMSHLRRYVESFKGQQTNALSELEEAKNRKENLQQKISGYNESIAELDAEYAELSDKIAAEDARREQNTALIEEEKQNIGKCKGRLGQIHEENAKIHEELVNFRAEQKDIIDKIIEEIDKKKKNVEHLSIYNDYEKREHDIEIGFNNILDSLKNKIERIKEFEDIGVFDNFSDASYKQLCDFVKSLKEKLSMELANTGFLKEIFEEYNQIKDPFMELLFSQEGIYRQKEEIDEKIRSMEERIVALSEESEDINKSISASREKIENAMSVEAQISTTLSRLRERKRSIEQSRARYLSDKEYMEKEIETNAAKLEKIENHIKSLDSELESNVNRLKKLEEQKAEVETQSKEKGKELKEAEKGIEGAQTEHNKKVKKLQEINAKSIRLQEKLLSIEERIEKTYNDFFENYSTNLKDFESKFELQKADEEALKAKVQKYNEQINRLGHINEMAQEEFYEAKERLNFLNEQKNDLEKSRDEIIAIIEQSNKEAAGRFEQTFHEINENFKLMFQALFGGGDASLSMTDSSRLLETGIEIFAQPPGKKMESIISYSGGELTKIGIALIFAIFKHKPAPFCVLDEVDAALDAANVMRFRELVKDFSKHTQFLMITHNENTATVANTYYGITAAEKGVSKIYSIKIDEQGKINNNQNVTIVESGNKIANDEGEETENEEEPEDAVDKDG